MQLKNEMDVLHLTQDAQMFLAPWSDCGTTLCCLETQLLYTLQLEYMYTIHPNLLLNAPNLKKAF